MRDLSIPFCTIILLLLGCGSYQDNQADTTKREKLIMEAITTFKADLELMSTQHQELANVQHFPVSELGFVFVNNDIEPRVHISLAVENISVNAINALPVEHEKLNDINIITALQLDCQGNDELRAKVSLAYADFKTRLQAGLSKAAEQGGQPDAASRRQLP